MPETIPVRPDERLDTDKLYAYLRQHMEIPAGDLVIEQFPAGHSNLTYLLRIGQWEAVLRRPPLGPVAPKAHDMERECRLLTRLNPVFPLAPKPYHFCNDNSVAGSTFYVMERKRGLVLDKRWPADLPRSPEFCQNVTEALIDTMVQLHNVDWQTVGLHDLGHPEGYLERQVQGWFSRYERAKTDELAEIPGLYRWMSEKIPASPSATIIHNDFKLNNVMLDISSRPRLTGVVDWEMATLGDPLAEVGLTLSYWTEPDDHGEMGDSVTALPEFPRRRDVLELYARKSGRDVSNMEWYLALGYFKIAVICQQIYFRWKNGQTQDPRFSALGPLAVKLIRRAANLAHNPVF